MRVRLVDKEEYSFIEDFVYEVFKESDFSDGAGEKALVREIREKRFYIPQLDLVVEEDGVVLGHFILSKFPISNKYESSISPPLSTFK